MKITKLEEAGYYSALRGVNLSYRKDKTVKSEPNYYLALKLAHKQGGHNKFLEAIMIWIEIEAPRGWWQQFDTYRVGVTKQSESTMHTIVSHELTQEDFERPLPPVVLEELNKAIEVGDLEEIKNQLPEGFLQTRVVALSYKTLQNIYKQRKNHKFLPWAVFVENVVSQINIPEFIDINKERNYGHYKTRQESSLTSLSN